MSFVTPPTQSSGYLVLNTDWNTLVNDLIFLNTPPQFQVHMATAVSIPNNATTNVNFDTVDIDNASNWNATTHQYTIGTAGLWLFTGSLIFANNSTGVREISFGGTLGQTAQNAVTAATDAFGRCNVAAIAHVAGTTSTIALNALQTSGAALNTGTGAGAIFLSGCKIG